jgi:hypothetical protein
MGTEIERGGQIIGLVSPTADNLAVGNHGGIFLSETPTGLGYDTFTQNSIVYPPYATIPPNTITGVEDGVPGSRYMNTYCGFAAPANSGNTFETLLGYDECNTAEVDRDWHCVTYLPMDTTSLNFKHLFDDSSVLSSSSPVVTSTADDGDVGTTASAGVTRAVLARIDTSRLDRGNGYTMAIMVRGPDATTPLNFEWEVVGHYEYVNVNARGRIPTATPDPVGMGAILGSVQSDLQGVTAPSVAQAIAVRTLSQQSGSSAQAAMNQLASQFSGNPAFQNMLLHPRQYGAGPSSSSRSQLPSFLGELGKKGMTMLKDEDVQNEIKNYVLPAVKSLGSDLLAGLGALF